MEYQGQGIMETVCDAMTKSIMTIVVELELLVIAAKTQNWDTAGCLAGGIIVPAGEYEWVRGT
jgi:hypothetical protein